MSYLRNKVCSLPRIEQARKKLWYNRRHHDGKTLGHYEIESLLGTGGMEPIVINLGVEIPEPGFMRRAQELCRKHRTLLVMDEIATGFERTG